METSILENIVKRTESELILFFIILVAFLIPIYRLILKDRKQRHEQYIEREKRIIEVITSNTTVMAGLKAALERDGIMTSSSLSQINDILKSHGEILARIEKLLGPSFD